MNLQGIVNCGRVYNLCRRRTCKYDFVEFLVAAQ